MITHNDHEAGGAPEPFNPWQEDDTAPTALLGCAMKSADYPDLFDTWSPLEAEEPASSQLDRKTGDDLEPFDPWLPADNYQAGGGKGVRGP